MEQAQVAQHPGTIDAYIRHGWSLVPIPYGTKGPRTAGWNLKENALKSYADLVPGQGIGLAHAYSGTMALDIDDWTLATAVLAELGITLDTFYNSSEMVQIFSGRHGHGKLLFKMPMGLTLPSKRIMREGRVALELRCATAGGLTVQDVLPPSIHPDTNQAYRWGGAPWQQMPQLPPTLFDWWMSMADDDRRPQIKTTGPIDASWIEIQSALDTIDPDCSRNEWVGAGMALHYAGSETGNEERAFQMWAEWSARAATKYKGPQELQTQWRSFRTDKPTAVRLGTLFKMARDRGWVRPLPDVRHLFSASKLLPANIVTEVLLPSPPALNFDLLPEILRRRALEAAEHIGCDPLVPVMAGMGAVCAAADARSRLELLPGFKVPPVLWLMTIGKPADKKTPGSGPMLDIVYQLQAEGQKDYPRELLKYEGMLARYKRDHKAFLDQVVSPEFLLNNQTEIPNLVEPRPPVSSKMITNDSTSQKVVRMAADRPAGLLYHLDEMKQWLSNVTNPRSGEDRSCWVSSYEAKPYTMDRVGAGSIVCENLAVSIVGNIQPEALRKQMGEMNDDGMMQRFLPAVLRTSQTKMGEPVPECLTSARDWNQAVRVVHSLMPQTYRLSQGAYKHFREFQRWYENEKQRNVLLDLNNDYQTAFGKLEGLTGRVMLLWHLLENPMAAEVTDGLAERVVEFIRTYVVPSMRYTFTELGNKSEFDHWLMEYVIRFSDQQQFTLAEIRRSAHRHLAGMSPMQQDNMIIGGMGLLEAAEWVKRIDDGTQEHRRIAQWAVNPEIEKAFAMRREQVKRAKQELVDKIRDTSPSTTDETPRTLVR